MSKTYIGVSGTITTEAVNIYSSMSTYFDVSSSGWYANNPGDYITDINGEGGATATLTLTAKQSLTGLQFGWTVSSEANFDKLTITVAGSTIVTASGEQSGIETVNLSSGQSIVCTYKKDSSVDSGSDIANVHSFRIPGGSSTLTNKAQQVKKIYLGFTGTYNNEVLGSSVRIGSSNYSTYFNSWSKGEFNPTNNDCWECSLTYYGVQSTTISFTVKQKGRLSVDFYTSMGYASAAATVNGSSFYGTKDVVAGDKVQISAWYSPSSMWESDTVIATISFIPITGSTFSGTNIAIPVKKAYIGDSNNKAKLVYVADSSSGGGSSGGDSGGGDSGGGSSTSYEMDSWSYSYEEDVTSYTISGYTGFDFDEDDGTFTLTGSYTSYTCYDYAGSSTGTLYTGGGNSITGKSCAFQTGNCIIVTETIYTAREV